MQVAPTEQNVDSPYLHDNSFADRSEPGYCPGMSLWEVARAICLLLHRFDTEGLGTFTVSNPLNMEAADQFMNDEPAFLAQAADWTRRYATREYHAQLLRRRWHGFYPDPALYECNYAHGQTSSAVHW